MAFSPSLMARARTRATDKIVSAREAVRLIRSGDTVIIGGFLSIGFPDVIVRELAEFYESKDEGSATFGKPSNLTIISAAGMAHPFKGGGMNRLAQPGLIKRFISSHFVLTPALQQLIVGNQIEGYNLPLGAICHLFRDIAAGKPGHASRIGLGTFVDPRQDGGKLNARTTEELVELISIGGEDYLFFKAVPVNVAIIRGTTADAEGNISMEREALTIDVLSVAMAAHNCGGIVIAQVERIAEAGTLNPRQVKVPGAIVDCIVVANGDDCHWQTFGSRYTPAYAAEVRVPTASVEPMPMSVRKIIARRAAMELRTNSVVNLGVGMPEGVAAIANEEKIADLMTLTAESGVIGGVPAGGLSFGAASNAQAVIDIGYQFDFYDGGGLDICFLGLAQADRQGNLNVSKFGPKLAGAGGFINISQNATKAVFCGTFTAGNLDVSIVGDKLQIERDGSEQKFVEEVEHRTFSGPYAAQAGKEVLYITERCVFRLSTEGLELIEVAPGIDIQRDIVGKMAFAPIVRQPRSMDPRIFRDEPMGLREDMLRLPFDARFKYDEEHNTLFINLSDLHINTPDFLLRMVEKVKSLVQPLGHKVYCVANYDGFELDRAVEDAYLDTVKEMTGNYLLGVTRFTTSAFMRAKLGETLAKRGVAAHIFESEEEATGAVRATLKREP
ncbi:MAG: malonate decarboxylase subunit alpha [Rhodocyclaceae bacterium]|nr:malonate decarboxylase subunit alpha [Rhodocyclaceae bacterium]MBX3668136.1 malonate decarboxylase subunit alpha [Rhodocyclaceae bacterium]